MSVFKAIWKKKNIFPAILAVWLVLWIFFMIREDKDGQYDLLRKLYGAGDNNEKNRVMMGKELYDFLVFARDAMPEGSTCELAGFEKFSIDEVRARYFLWPFKCAKGDTDFKIVFEGPIPDMPGYEEVKGWEGKGHLLGRK